MDKIALTCPYGLITQIVDNGIGITPSTSKVRDACMVDEAKFSNQQCSI